MLTVSICFSIYNPGESGTQDVNYIEDNIAQSFIFINGKVGRMASSAAIYRA